MQTYNYCGLSFIKDSKPQHIAMKRSFLKCYYLLCRTKKNHQIFQFKNQLEFICALALIDWAYKWNFMLILFESFNWNESIFTFLSNRKLNSFIFNLTTNLNSFVRELKEQKLSQCFSSSCSLNSKYTAIITIPFTNVNISKS